MFWIFFSKRLTICPARYLIIFLTTLVQLIMFLYKFVFFKRIFAKDFKYLACLLRLISRTFLIPSRKQKETFYSTKKYFQKSYMNSLPTFRQFQVIHVNNFHLFLLKFVFKLKPKIFEQRGWLAYGASKYIGVAFVH